MSTRRIAYSLIAIALTILTRRSPTAHAQQPSAIVVTVVDDLSRRPLANADVTDLETGRHRLTNEEGKVALTWPPNRALRLRVREVGYQPIERTLTPGQDTEGAAIFGMSRIAYVIAPVHSTSRCANDADEASRLLSVTVLDQLRHGAEKYEQFRLAYPYNATVESRHLLAREPGKTEQRVIRRTHPFKSDRWEEKYRPGDIVINVNSPRFQVPTLFLSTLADPAFWEHHCFVAKGVEELDEKRVVRLEFTPTADTRGSDWEGAALIDSATSVLKRVEFRVANLRPGRGPQRIQGYTTFRTLSPFVVMPDTTVAIWWLRRPADGAEWGDPDVGEMRYLSDLKFRKATPPALQAQPTSSPPR